MTSYLDTSVVIALLTTEHATPRVRPWAAGQPPNSLATSAWVATEVSSALSIKVRTGELTADQRTVVQAAWDRLRRESLIEVPIPPLCFEVAGAFAARHELGLRASDAFHLAIAASAGHAVATLDRAMSAAGPSLGVPIVGL